MEEELLAIGAAIPFVGSDGHADEFDGEGRCLLFEGDGATTHVDGAVAAFGVQELARPVEKLVLMLARCPCTSHSALQAR